MQGFGSTADYLSWGKEKFILKLSRNEKIFHPNAIIENIIKLTFFPTLHCLFLFFKKMSAGCRFGLFKGAVIRAVFMCPYYKGPSSPGGQKAEGGTCPLMLKLQGLRPPGSVLTPSQESFLCSYVEGSVPGHLECAPWGFDQVAGRRARSPGENPLSHS